MKRRATGLALVAALGCAPEHAAPAPPPLELVDVGEDAGAGNVLGIELFAEPALYASVARFAARLDERLARAADEGWLSERTVVVLPEYAGTWLVALDQNEDVTDAETTEDAMTPVVLSNLPAFVPLQLGAPAEDRDTYAVFAMKAERVAAAYGETLATLAAGYGVTVVGGSVLLPDPRVENGAIAVSPGAPLFNTSFVFGPDGTLHEREVRKVFPTEDELGFVAAGEAGALPVFDTPAGRLGVLVCADAWFPEATAALAQQEAEIVVVPQYVTGAGLWNEPWGGYSGHATPADVDDADVDALTEGQAWRKYALARLERTGAHTAAIVPLRGALWDLGTDGQALLSRAGERAEGGQENVPRLVNVWLPGDG